MRREISKSIEFWNRQKTRKPLILMGARQVGKSWLMEDFARRVYPENAVVVNFMEDEPLRESFERASLDPRLLVELLQVRGGRKIVPGKTLLILDEIQESPRAVTSLKFFAEKMPGW